MSYADSQVWNPAPEYAYAGHADTGGYDWAGPGASLTTADPVFPSTVRERMIAPVPMLRLVTGDQVAQTRMSGARAGRGPRTRK
jgi:hypothetical protein